MDPLADPVAVKRKVGVVPEDLALFDRLTGAETLAFVGQVHGLDKASVRARSAELFELMDLTGAANDLVADYSHGMRKKIALVGRAAAGAAPAVPRRAVRGHRRDRVAPDQGPARRTSCTAAARCS